LLTVRDPWANLTHEVMATMRNRLLLGSAWGVLLAALPALVMARPGWSGRRPVLAGLGTRFLQGLLGGAFAALLIWALMALTLSGFTLENPVDLSVIMSPRVFLGSFFVALSIFLYAVAGGTLLGPAFGRLVNRAVRGEP
jgi:hypothetical protein